jgi:hypothetical protein
VFSSAYDALGPVTPDTVLAFHRRVFGGHSMSGAGSATAPEAGSAGDAGAGGASAGGAATTTTTTAPAAGGGQQTTQGQTGKTFTQADLDRIVGERLADEQKKFQTQLEQAQATAGKSELEAAQIERDRYKDQATTITQQSAQKVAAAEAKAAAFLAGAKADRVAHVVKNADLTKAVSEDGSVDEAKVQAAIEAVLTEFPEWKTTPGTQTPGSSGGELTQGGGQKPTYTREQIRSITAEITHPSSNLSREDRQKKLAELQQAVAEGRITG